MATKKEEEEFLKQEAMAKKIFWTIFGFLIAWILLLIVFHFVIAYDPDKGPDWIQYLRWFFAALVGASTYLLWNIAYWYQKIRAEDKNGRANFNKYGLWYASTITRAPILTVVLLWILTNTSIDIGNEVKLTLKAMNAYVLLGIAFILGYYGRVALSQLDIIAKTFFPKAWAMAVQGFDVAAPKILLLKEKFTFATEPVSDVVWSATPSGTMEAGIGTYTAPKEITRIDEKVIIRASLKNEPSVTGFKEVVLKLFKIDGKENIETDEKDVKYTLKSNIVKDEELAKANWTIVSGGGSLNQSTGKEVTFTPPVLDPKEDKKEVTLEAKITHEGERKAQLVITVNKDK